MEITLQESEGKRMQKLVLFGAGKIGRSFVGQLFSRAGYEVVFIDISVPVIQELNKRHTYNVIIKSDEYEEIIPIRNVRGVLASDSVSVAEEICTADILATAVGINALPHVFPLIARGLLRRYAVHKGSKLDIIIAENMRDAADYFDKELKKETGTSYPFDELIGLVETSIGKMVPIMSEKDMKKDILQVFAEPYNTLILDKKGFKNPVPAVDGIAAKEHIKAWVDRKSFIHNLGHAATAYIGNVYDRNFTYLYEALAVQDVFREVREIMLQSADILLQEYPEEFTIDGLTTHIDDLLKRFMNKALGDTIFRVGKDVIRKLGPEDRITGVIKKGITDNMPVNKILRALVCGMYFRATGEDGNMFERDTQFVNKFFNKGTRYVLIHVCGFNEDTDAGIIQKCERIAHSIEQGFKDEI
jgi:mannitol-1-phosphate 5-dehydrogenase